MDQNMNDQLHALKEQGLTFADCVELFAEGNDDRAEALIDYARENKAVEGEIEIDDTTITSGSSGDGDYVLAWVWVDNDEAGVSDDEDEPDEACGLCGVRAPAPGMTACSSCA